MLELISFAMLGTLWFWVCALLAIVSIWSVRGDNVAPPLICAFFAVFVLNYFGDIPIFAFIKDNPADIIIYVLGYMAVGVIWGFVKWVLFVQNKKRLFPEFKKNFLGYIDDLDPSYLDETSENYLKIPVLHKVEFKKASACSEFPPKANYNKQRIITWMLYWVLSVVGTIFGDLIKEIYEYIYTKLTNSFDSVSKFMFRDFEELN